ncbi:MAG: hypothetical protein P0S94_03110, partial [Simkaniaceae bacterium]|nr:hypothetical protein [Simkaniaceae bacterium]
HSNVRDLPTDKQIPAELVGAAYTWKAAGESFLIITQGVQAKDAADGATTWKLWFEKVGLDGPGEQRFAQVKDFIQ